MPKKRKKVKARSTAHARQRKRTSSSVRIFSPSSKSSVQKMPVQKRTLAHAGKSLVKFSFPFFSHQQKKSASPSKMIGTVSASPLSSKPAQQKPSVQKPSAPAAKDRRKYRIIYSLFLIISLGLTILSFIQGDLFSFAVGIAMMILSILCYRVVVESKQQKNLIIYVMVWPFTLSLAVAAIFKKEIISFIISILAMFVSLLTPMLALKQAKKEEIVTALRAVPLSVKDTETDFDRLLLILQKYGKLRISDIRNAFGIEKGKAEEWAKILEENNLAYIHYPTFGEEELRIKEKKEKKA